MIPQRDAAARAAKAFPPEGLAERVIPIRRILCAGDREGADEAIRQAGALSRAYGASLEILHVKVGAGASDTVIVRRADEVAADLIVVGGEGETGLATQRLGEVARRVVRHARGSVLVARRGPGSGKILAATDFSDPSLPAVASAAEETRRRGASLTVVHNVDPELDSFGPEVVSTLLQLFSDDIMAEVGRGARDRLVEVLRRLGVEGEAVITHGAASASILRLAQELPADLVVVGRSGGTGLANALVGSVAERVVRWAECSVLVVRRHA